MRRILIALPLLAATPAFSQQPAPPSAQAMFAGDLARNLSDALGKIEELARERDVLRAQLDALKAVPAGKTAQ